MADKDHPPKPADKHSIRLLLVDDVEENLDLLEDIFSELGYGVVRATSGPEALERLHKGEIHLIIADALMPRMDGFQLCKEVKSKRELAKIPFVIYSGDYVNEEDETFAKNIGVDRYVVKHHGVKSLIASVNELSSQQYGYIPKTSIGPTTMDDRAFLDKHHDLVSRKLGEKMFELEVYAKNIAQQNHALQLSESQYRSLFEHASVAIFIVARETGKVLDTNRQGLALLGYTKDELAAMSVLPFAEHEAVLSSLIQGKLPYSAETVMRAKSGDLVDVDLSAGPVAQIHDNRILLYVKNITEQKKMRLKLIEGEKVMLMGYFAAGIAHEIRNPLAAVMMNLQHLFQITDKEFSGRDAIEAALEGAQRIEQVATNTLNFARRTPPALKQESINEIVDSSLWFLKFTARQKNLGIKTHFANELPSITVDSKQIQQVVLNLLQNAIDASPQDGIISITTNLAEESLFNGESVSPKVFLAIKDSGPGISSEESQHIFEPFRTTKAKGTGLGLALSKHIIDRHNAKIRLETAPEGGTIARVIFSTEPITLGALHVKG